jgi:hypothetical protein
MRKPLHDAVADAVRRKYRKLTVTAARVAIDLWKLTIEGAGRTSRATSHEAPRALGLAVLLPGARRKHVTTSFVLSEADAAMQFRDGRCLKTRLMPTPHWDS